MTVRLLGLACATALLSACSGSGAHFSAGHLQKRLDANLASAVAEGQASVQPLRNGAVVTLNEPGLFVDGGTDLTADGRSTLSSVTESLLDPRLMRVYVRGAAQTPDFLRDQRAQTVQQFIEAFALGPPLPMTTEPQAATSPSAQGLALEIHVVCPPGPQGSTWKYEVTEPTCN